MASISDAPTAASAAAPLASDASGHEHSYGQILKSSVLIGGSQAFNVVIGIVRTKAMAVLLGPAGFGLMGLYSAIVNLAQCIAGMGVNSSGVRQIAAAVGSGDTACVARTAIVLRRAALALGVLGGALLIALSGPVSQLTFGNREHAAAVALLAFAVLFKAVSDGQGALIQGLRRISDLARIAVLGGFFGAVLSISLVYVLGEPGVVPALIGVAGMSLLFSWWFSRRVRFVRPTLSLREVGEEVRGLLQLGLAFMASGLLTMGTAYAVRLFIVRQIDFEAAGFFQSAWTIGGLYVGFILQAMGADFYPRLTGAIGSHDECNRLVNEQAEVSLLLAGPGVIGTLALAPLVISLLYSSAFHQAVEVLRWICLGATLQVVTWPMGFIIVAKGRQGVFFGIELVYTIVHLGMAWVFLKHFGINGAGAAFFGSYVFHGLLVYPIVRRMTGFRWSRASRRLGLVFLPLIGLVFGSFYVLPFWLATTLGTVAALLNGLYSVRVLGRLLSAHRVPGPLRRLLVWARVWPRDVR